MAGKPCRLANLKIVVVEKNSCLTFELQDATWISRITY